ncbi:MAG TPA: hypothetical protein DCZ94_22300 [Lentisphaeria bacterium]|nr:MAG: hypothetical protein A2X48_13540 [Lentisphaerae bacterium GWF2_49_21]HBC89680.1 hypothetical protein [Lentisphaeria bacterium]
MKLKKTFLGIACSAAILFSLCMSAQDKAPAPANDKMPKVNRALDLKDINILDDLNVKEEGQKKGQEDPPARKVARIDVPPEAEIKKAVADIKGIYAARYKPTDAKARRGLAEELLGEAKKNEHPAPVRYAFFIESAQVYSLTGDAALVMSTLKEMGKVFKISRFELAGKELAETEKFAKLPEDLVALAKAYLECYRSSFQNELFDDALKNLNSASIAAKKANNNELLNDIREYSKEAQSFKKEYSLVAGAFEKLKTVPDDPAANFAAGKFYCFIMDKWEKGIPMLARGMDEKIRQLALEELKNPEEVNVMTQLADGWWSLSEDKDYRLLQNELSGRACYWYEKILPSLASLEKIKIEKKIDLANSAAGVKHSSANLPKGAVLAFSFEKNTAIKRGGTTVISDLSGQGNYGIVHGARFVKGMAGDAVDFNGKESFIEVKESKSLALDGNLTIAMWLDPVDFAERRNPFNKSYGGEGTMTIESSGVVNFFYGSTGKDIEGGYTGVNSSKALIPGKWNHIAVVRDMKTAKVIWYINGEISSETALEIPNIKASKLNILIGKGYVGSYMGMIDELAIFTKALPEKEVKELFNLGKKGQSF